MKKIISLFVISAALLTSSNTWAERGGGLGLGFIAGAIVGTELAYPYYSRPIIYAPPPAVVYTSPTTVVAPPMQTYQAPSQSVWYYCQSLSTYYPYVTQCPEPWQIVPSTPR